ncbi:MAG: glycosyltransferase, partial [Lentilitoribacter sp.]
MVEEYCQDTGPSVAIIVGYFNGNRYLNDQIKSILNQTHKNIKIVIFDDCSNEPVDVDALNLSPEEHTFVHIVVREYNLGFSNNFLQGLSYFEDEFDYYAFSDQDDIWDPDKIEVALNQLTTISENTPAL